jgi:hypothetical protein
MIGRAFLTQWHGRRFSLALRCSGPPGGFKCWQILPAQVVAELRLE